MSKQVTHSPFVYGLWLLSLARYLTCATSIMYAFFFALAQVVTAFNCETPLMVQVGNRCFDEMMETCKGILNIAYPTTAWHCYVV